jgi:hypothetical protein
MPQAVPEAVKAEDLITEIDIVLYNTSQQISCLGRLLRVRPSTGSTG